VAARRDVTAVNIFQWRGRTSKKAFLDRFREALRQHIPDVVIEEGGELELRVAVPPDHHTKNIWLGRAYDEFCKTPAEADEIIGRWLRMIAATGSSAIDPDQLIPVIKNHEWLTAQGATGQFTPWTEPYNAQLILVMAEYKDGVRFSPRSEIEALGIPLGELRERAFGNLRRRIQDVSVTGQGGEYLLGAGGTIDASLLLLDGVTDDPRIELQGQPLVAVSDRDSFWVADDANPYAVFGIAAKVASCYRSEPYPISKELFRKSDGIWQPLDPEPHDGDHAIPKLDVIDIIGRKRDGGVDLVIIVSRALSTDARSVFRLFTKIDGYLREISAESWRAEFPNATPESTRIVIKLHRDTDAVIAQLLESFRDWVKGRGAQLVIEELETGG
jgi:hypothetical protein